MLCTGRRHISILASLPYLQGVDVLGAWQALAPLKMSNVVLGGHILSPSGLMMSLIETCGSGMVFSQSILHLPIGAGILLTSMGLRALFLPLSFHFYRSQTSRSKLLNEISQHNLRANKALNKGKKRQYELFNSKISLLRKHLTLFWQLSLSAVQGLVHLCGLNSVYQCLVTATPTQPALAAFKFLWLNNICASDPMFLLPLMLGVNIFTYLYFAPNITLWQQYPKYKVAISGAAGALGFLVSLTLPSYFVLYGVGATTIHSIAVIYVRKYIFKDRVESSRKPPQTTDSVPHTTVPKQNGEPSNDTVPPTTSKQQLMPRKRKNSII